MTVGRALLISGVAAVAMLAATGRGLAADPTRGRALFTAKACARCHQPAGRQGIGPDLEKLARRQGAFELVGRLWNHAPAMFTVLHQDTIEWPQMTSDEMADLMAYLNADPARDRAPDPARGETLLVEKGCLKCHRVRREGRRVGPDLDVKRPEYESAAAWAARMWVHAPRMAAKAIEMGVLYPRFSDDEMADLVAFLRNVAR